MQLSKESKIRVLENFYALDYVFFGKSVKEAAACCPAMLNEFIAVKGALLSVLVEMYKLVEHSPTALTERVSSKKLRNLARESARVARENCKRILASSKGRADVKASLRETIAQEENVNVDELVQTKIREKAFSLAVDNLLIAKTIAESKHYDKLNGWEGKIIEDAYKVLRDSLVENAMVIIDGSE